MSDSPSAPQASGEKEDQPKRQSVFETIRKSITPATAIPAKLLQEFEAQKLEGNKKTCKERKQACLNLTARSKRLYLRDADYWDFWDETIWNPGPFKNRNKNNMFVAGFSSVVSIIYLAVAFGLILSGRLRHVQDETLYRTTAKLNFDLIYIHYFNIFQCGALALGTFYFVDTTQRVFMIVWLLSRPVLWINSVRNFNLFLMRPHAYVLYNAANTEWRLQYLSSNISYWLTVFYWAFNIISWIYEWFIVIAYYYFISLKAPITTSVIPTPLHRIMDSALTEPCDPNKEFTLLCPTPKPWKNPNNKKVFAHPPLTAKTDNRVRRIP